MDQQRLLYLFQEGSFRVHQRRILMGMYLDYQVVLQQYPLRIIHQLNVILVNIPMKVVLE